MKQSARRTVFGEVGRSARVLAKVLPQVITSGEEHEHIRAEVEKLEVEKLMDKGEHRTAEEDAALDLTSPR